VTCRVQPQRADLIVADLHTQAVLDRMTEPLLSAKMCDAPAEDVSLVHLFKLIAVDRIVEEIGEVREQV
jgi:hypothetical protein